MNNIIECESCGAKMRVKPATLRIVKELKCAKCRKTIVIPPEMKAAAKDGTINTSVAKPTAPKVMAPPPPPPTPTAKPKPIPIQTVANKVEPPQPQPQVLKAESVASATSSIPPAQASTPPPPPPAVSEPGLMAKRVTNLEKSVAELEARIAGLLKAEQQSAQQLVATLEKL